MTAPPTAPPDGDPRTGSEPPSRRRWWRWLALGALGLVVAVVAVVVVTGGDDSGPDPDSQARAGDGQLPAPPEAVEPVIDPTGQRLVDLLEAGRSVEHHAVYVAGGDPELIGGALEIETWRRGDRYRLDSRFDSPAGVAETAGFVIGDTTIVCVRQGTEEWVCSQRQVSGNEIDGIFGTVREQLAGAEVTETTEDIDGRTAHCFGVESPEGPVELCVSDDGIPLRLQNEQVSLVLETLDTDVPDDVFTPPAEPVQVEDPDG